MTPNISHPFIRVLAAGAAVLWLTAAPAAADVPAGVPPAVTQPSAAKQPVVGASTTPAAPTVAKAGRVGASVTFSDPKCTKFMLTGTAPNQTVTCQ